MGMYEVLKEIRPLRAAVRGARKWLERYRVDAWSLAGRERYSGESLTAFIAGQLENKNYIAEIMFEQPCSQTHRRVWRRDVNRALRSENGKYTIVVYDTTMLPIGEPRRDWTFLLPSWVMTELDLTFAIERLQRSESARYDVKRLLRRGYGFKISTAESEFEEFYDRMYLPYAARRFGGQSIVATRKTLIEVTKSGAELLLVTRNGEQVAGAILLYQDPEAPKAWTLGVRDGNLDLVKEGVLTALYYFQIKHLSDKGLRRLRLGGTRSFLRDGVLQFKKKWGAKIVGAHEIERRWFVLRAAQASAAARAFLKHNPFVNEDEGGLRGAFLVEGAGAEADAEALRWRNEFSALGIAQTILLRSNASEAVVGVGAVHRDAIGRPGL